MAKSSSPLRILQIILAVIVLAAVVAPFFLFTVKETERRLVLRFGRVDRVAETPGLHFKYPMIETTLSFESRLLRAELRTTEDDDVLTKDQRRVVVDAFAQWRISDTERFYESFTTESAANRRLAEVLFEALRNVLGDNDFDSLLDERRAGLMQAILERAREDVKDFGVIIEDVRIRRADLPQQNLQATFERMQSERQQEAEGLRANGQADKNAQIARARSAAARVVADAQVSGLTCRGLADAAGYRLINDAIGGDAEFHSFYRSMQAYETTLADGQSRLVLSPNSGFFDYFRDSHGRGVEEADAEDAAAPAPPPSEADREATDALMAELDAICFPNRDEEEGAAVEAAALATDG